MQKRCNYLPDRLLLQNKFLQPGNSDTFIDIFERRIVAARDLFATQATLMGTL